eukprot:11152946-Karenia_brevis.AAC.1
MSGNEIADYKGVATLATLYDMENFMITYPSQRSSERQPGVTVPHNGIIAGCTQSTTFAKILLHAKCQHAYDAEITAAMARGYPQGYAATFRTFVDDINSISRGKES